MGSLAELILGPHCPFCNCRAYPKLHRNCPALRGKTPQQTVAIVSAKVRDILQDEPADQLVHTTYEAIEHLEQTFKPEAK